MAAKCSHWRRVGRALACLPLVVTAVTVAPIGQPEAGASIGTGTYDHANGFDTCANITNTGLDAWWNNTPWWHIGLYIGGANGEANGCDPLSVSVFDYAVDVGFAVVPYFYGRQLPTSCGTAPQSIYISLNTTTARAQGVSAADAANTAALAYHLGGGGILYLDLESGDNSSTCLAAAKAFVGGWSEEINSYTSYWAGLYGSTCGSKISDFSALQPSHPGYISASDPGRQYSSVDGLLCLSDSLWTGYQRIHQFVYGRSLTYNGYHMIVDEDCAYSVMDTNHGDVSPHNCALIT